VSTPSRRAASVAVVIVVALAAAWVIPVLGAVAVWPFLLIVPGRAIVAAAAPRIDVAGRIGLAVVLTVAISTHLVYWLSHLAGGYGREVVFVAAALLAAPLPIAAWRRAPVSRLRATRGAVPGLAVAGVTAAVVGGTLARNLWRLAPTGVVSGGSNWSDFGVHLSIAETLNSGGNFPPEVPYLSGAPLVYHWFADFHAAILARAIDDFSPPSMVVQSTVLAAALALLVYSIARRLVRGPYARRVATLAAVLAVFAGGMGWIRLVGDVTAGAGDPLTLIARTSYDNQWLTEWPYFRVPSVMSTGLLAHRATTAGLPILVGAMLLLVAGLPRARARAAGWRDHRGAIALAGLLGALLAPFHFFFFPAFPALALAWVLAGGRLLDAQAPRNAVTLLAPMVLALPFAVPLLLHSSGTGALELVQGWGSVPRDDGRAAVAFFWVTNLGVPFLVALVALGWPRLPHRAFLAAWVLGLFLVPNVVQASVIDFDMNKYFQAMWIGVAVLAAWLMRRWPWPSVVVMLGLSLPSPLLATAWTATSDLQVLSRGELAAAAWMREHTPPDAVFVTDGWLSSPTDPAGRRRLTTFAPYIANLGYEPDERISHVTSIYCGGSAELSASLMRRYGATYLVDGGRPQPCGAPVDFGASSWFQLVYDGDPRIWRLTD
jgi:hypothetical protein